MHPSLRRCSARAHTPLIRFLGKRSHPTSADTPHPHPAAPAEFKERFSEFLTKMNSSGASSKASSSKPSSSGNTNTFNQFWEAPSRFWQPRVREMSKAEMDAIMSGGASSY
ncbi:hypothetical protein D9619_000942 [Psilocybe cf. subviscida]|uniref:Uncharacterized protein n=1 Tax=Psilocybe cf. subviscida TaxID=2480587 RepID=A0A8H5BGE8_9AGAR|nr:hypothetical protein D9619_000942 [Psilocybe cf. subviscida]